MRTITSNYQIGFQIPSTPVAEGIFAFHDDLIRFLVGILIFVIYIMYVCLRNFAVDADIADNREIKHTVYGKKDRLVHWSTLEIIWTIIPALILAIIAIPSFALLYSIDEVIEPMFTVKVMGHQWYWTYEFIDPQLVYATYETGLVDSDADTFQYDSYILADDELREGNKPKRGVIRLLTVDNHLFMPVKTHIRAIITSADVLHSWAVPSLGIKLDACPGRLNQTSLFIKRKAIYYGQCSEICGVNHGFRPIGIVCDSVDPILIGGNLFDYEALLCAFSLN